MNESDIPLSSAASIFPVEECEFVTPPMFGNILPDMSSVVAMVEGEKYIEDKILDATYSTENSMQGSPDYSREGFRYLEGYVAYRGR